ncbi:hypothetical protein EW146_g5365 [Bondarzewia mesenterica]|uniref:Uncharacterized protein n=1 Tax=Bondarzewia mesenterica TaxID=1095465 RepID=A0A4S4LRR2_9AGAM|nr:hypothetical protein EW146_g5365 [Bondarzewia mesenterica]
MRTSITFATLFSALVWHTLAAPITTLKRAQLAQPPLLGDVCNTAIAEGSCPTFCNCAHLVNGTVPVSRTATSIPEEKVSTSRLRSRTLIFDAIKAGSVPAPLQDGGDTTSGSIGTNNTTAGPSSTRDIQLRGILLEAVKAGAIPGMVEDNGEPSLDVHATST